MATAMLSSIDSTPAPGLDTSDPFERALHAAFQQYQEKCRLLDAALQEVATLRAENEQLKAGKSTEVVIEGRRFVLAPGSGFLTAPANGRNPLEDSFVLTKD